jgi:DNA-directed RNA polymerase specialized sigma24 family protein
MRVATEKRRGKAKSKAAKHHPPRCRGALLTGDIAESWTISPRMTHDQIARRLGITRGGVQMAEARALQKLSAAIAAMDRLTLCRRDAASASAAGWQRL